MNNAQFQRLLSLNKNDYTILSVKEEKEKIIVFCKDKRECHICPKCRSKCKVIWTTYPKLVYLKHIVFNNKLLVLAFKKRRRLCKKCNLPFTEKIRIRYKNKSYTKVYRNLALKKIKNNNYTDTAKELKTNDMMIYRILSSIILNKVYLPKKGFKHWHRWKVYLI